MRHTRGGIYLRHTRGGGPYLRQTRGAYILDIQGEGVIPETYKGRDISETYKGRGVIPETYKGRGPYLRHTRGSLYLRHTRGGVYT